MFKEGDYVRSTDGTLIQGTVIGVDYPYLNYRIIRGEDGNTYYGIYVGDLEHV